MKQINIMQAFAKMLPKMARVSPSFFALWMATALVHGVVYGVIAPVTQYFLDKATAFSAQKIEVAAVVAALLALGLAHVVKQALNGTANLMNTMYYRRAEGVLSVEVHQKMSRLTPICFEDTRTLDDINKAIQGKNEAVWFTGSLLLMCTFYLPYFVIMAVYLFKLKPLLIISLALVFMPVLLSQILRTKFFAEAEDASAPVRRALDYYESCMTEREYFKETRVLGAFSYFKNLYTDALALLNKVKFRASIKSDLARFGMQMLSLGGHVGIFLLLLDALLKGDIGVGAFAAIFASIEQMVDLMNEWVCDNLGAVARDFGRVRNYFRFMQMPEREGADIDLPEDVGISLSGVSFSYPGAEQKAVDDVSLTIRHGETIALVGENGSGKTTLVRLITGLYLPNEGDVLYGEANTKAIASPSLFRNISAVFQKYQRYQMTLRENVGVSNVSDTASDTALNKISVQAGIDKSDDSFPDGYDTMLSREFDGVDLSGGQWQRVAIARSFFRAHEFIVLDEPTAAIDPIEETRIYNRFAEISKDKTAVIVTHRLGSVKLADRILVMKQGRLVEQGSHAELIAVDGEYARLYRSQEQWYRA